MTAAQWTPGIGDPTIVGWLTVLAYLIAALLCWRAGGRSRWWVALALFLLALAANKQLDLQSLFTAVARDAARAQGWYDARRGYQLAFFVGLAIAGTVGGIAALIAASRSRNPCARLAVIGTLLLSGFILVRVASFHHVDVLMRMRFAGARFYWILELAPIALIALAAGRSAALGRRA